MLALIISIKIDDLNLQMEQMTQTIMVTIISFPQLVVEIGSGYLQAVQVAIIVHLATTELLRLFN